MRWISPVGVVAAALAASVAGAAAAATITVTIKGLEFFPAEVTARLGDTIEWTNDDFVSHTATARNKDWDVSMPRGEIGRLVIEKAGDIDYFCRFHPNMTGKISVAAD